MKMNGRDRILLALAGAEPDVVPCALNFYHVEVETLLPPGQSQDGLVDVDFVQFPLSPEEAELSRTAEPYSPDTRLGTLAQVTTYTHWQYQPHNPDHSNPLALARTLDDLRDFPFPDVHTPYLS